MPRLAQQHSDRPTGSWSLFSNHGHVLFCLAESPDSPLREVAIRVGITERAVQRIVSDLESVGFVSRERIGRTHHYVINKNAHLRHDVEKHRTVGNLVELIVRRGD